VNGLDVLLGVLAGAAAGVAATALRWRLVRRHVRAVVPPSPDVVEAERTAARHNH
jgi:hypothetical protein